MISNTGRRLGALTATALARGSREYGYLLAALCSAGRYKRILNAACNHSTVGKPNPASPGHSEVYTDTHGEIYHTVLGGPRIASPFANPKWLTSATVSYGGEASSKGAEVPEGIKTTYESPTKSPLPDAGGKPTQASPRLNSNSIKSRMVSVLPTHTFNRLRGILKIDPDLSDEEKRRRKLERNTKLGGVFVLTILGGGVVGFCLYYGRAKRDENGRIIRDAHSGSWLAPLYRIYDGCFSLMDFALEPSRKLLLPDPVPYPYYQPKYTVVIEMKNILVSSEWSYKTGHRFKKRPALDYFLETLGYPNFELVIYTGEPSLSMQPVAEAMDPKKKILYHLYRDSTKFMNGHYVKDLSRLNRDLRKVIYIDHDPNAFKLNPENVLCVPKWTGDPDDTSLMDLAELIKTVHMSDVEDVRPILQYYSQFDDPAAEFRRRAAALAEEDQQHKAKAEGGFSTPLQRFGGRLFGAQRHQRT